MNKKPGFSIIELLLAAAIFGVLMSILASMFNGANRSHRAIENVANRMQLADVASQLLSYEIGLAGYRGVNQATVAANDFGGTNTSRLIITKGPSEGSDTITTRYYEDRFVSSTVLRTVTYSVGTVGGISSLLRQDGTGTYPAVYGVSKFQVKTYVARDGTRLSATSSQALPTNPPLVALELELTFSEGTVRTFAVSLSNLDLGTNPGYASLFGP